MGKTTNDTFFRESVFGMGEEVAVTNCVFKKCALLTTRCLPCFQQTQQLQQKKCMLKTTDMYEKLWVVFEHGKEVSLFCVFCHVWFVVVGYGVFVCFVV